jgi:regulator of cell morphogenesis and NO signaling
VSELVEHIVSTHHAYTKKSCYRFLLYLQVAQNMGIAQQLHKIFEDFIKLKAELEQHMFKEEKILFPRIKQLDGDFYLEQQALSNECPDPNHCDGSG